MTDDNPGRTVTNTELITSARRHVHPMTLARADMDAATVASAILAENGEIYERVCISLSCGLGFCAEAAAMANMIKDRQTRILKILAVSQNTILSPCGRCREMMVQVDVRNFDAKVVLGVTGSVKLAELLPRHWMRA